MKLKLLFLVYFLALLASVAYGAPTGIVLFQNPDGSVTLQWDANSETDLAGYKVYWGTVSRTYGPPTSIGKVTTFTTPKLANATYFFAVTAYNTSGLESGFSNEVSATVALPPLPPANLRIIKPPEVMVLNRKGANIYWATTIPSTTRLEYNREGFEPGWIEDLTLRLDHTVAVTGLQPNKNYSFIASSTAQGQTAQASGSFTTR